MGRKKKGPESPASPRLEAEDVPDVYNDAPEMAEEVASGAGNDDAAAKAAAEESAAAAKAEEEAKWAAEAKARAEAKVQAAAAAEAAAKAEAKAAADAAKVALAKAEAEAAAAAQLASEQAAVTEVPLAMADADLESGDGEKFVTVVTETATDATGRLSQLSIDDARAGLWLLSQRHVQTSKSKLTSPTQPTRTPRGLGWVRTGYAASCLPRWVRTGGAGRLAPRAPRTVRTGDAYQATDVPGVPRTVASQVLQERRARARADRVRAGAGGRHRARRAVEGREGAADGGAASGCG